jgi:predicted MFS family arabinose efflux permease
MFSFYWSAHITGRRNLLRANLIGAWILARLPFLFVPWIENSWYLIFCCASYELFHKSGIPALMEILKINIPKETREKTFTLYFVISFLESILLGLFIGKILDTYSFAWQIICGATALLGLSSIFLQLRVPIPHLTQEPPPSNLKPLERIIKPWQEAYALLKKYPEFARFQWGFMMGGFGLMLIAPSLSVFYVDSLNLSHVDIVTGRSVLMGLGIVLSSYFWQHKLRTTPIAQTTATILIGFSLYPLLLAFSPFHMGSFYLAFIVYGIAQAGSHILWNLSGTLFSQEEDSSPFSRLNILMLGLRGAIAPALGGLSCQLFGPIPLLITGSLICSLGALYTVMKPISAEEKQRR